MHPANTTEELEIAVREICALRDIDPVKQKKQSKPNIEIRSSIQEKLEDIALKNDDFHLYGVNFTAPTNPSEKQIKSAKNATKASSFGKFVI